MPTRCPWSMWNLRLRLTLLDDRNFDDTTAETAGLLDRRAFLVTAAVVTILFPDNIPIWHDIQRVSGVRDDLG
jgi:hypothetical protein